jgi:hypothetical protein
MPIFEWDEAKRQTNAAKHGIDLVDAALVFDGRPKLTVVARAGTEERFLSVAVVRGRCRTVVWTWRDGRIRLISFRRSRDEEEDAYRERHGQTDR